jgi:SPP1 gp7 family putative phage head morphogenesis protein
LIREADYIGLENRLETDLFWLIFAPLVQELKRMVPSMTMRFDRMRNSADDALREAIRSGRIQYMDGVFSGKLSAAITVALRALGARLNRRTGNYELDAGQVPQWVKSEAVIFDAFAREGHERINKILDLLEDTVEESADKFDYIELAPAASAEKDFRQAARSLGIHPELKLDTRKRLAETYNNNLKLKVKDFSKKQVQDLRDQVEENAQSGYRFEELIKRFNRRYEITQNKAKFLARQETALYMSKFRSLHFGEMGITHYRWSTSHDAKVRPTADAKGDERLNDHRSLDGRIFRYDDPPIVDRATGRRANPGEDYNCRCVDIPVVEAAAEVA